VADEKLDLFISGNTVLKKNLFKLDQIRLQSDMIWIYLEVSIDLSDYILWVRNLIENWFHIQMFQHYPIRIQSVAIAAGGIYVRSAERLRLLFGKQLLAVSHLY